MHPGELASRLKTRIDSYLIKYSYLLKRKIAMFPKGIVFVINENCNAQCSMCDIGTKSNQTHIYKLMSPGAGGYLALGDFKKVIDSVIEKKPEIWLMGTEPLLYPHFLEAAGYVKNKGLSFLFTSNGILLPKYAQDIVKLGVKHVLLSVTGGDSASHDKILGIRGAFDKLIRGLELINAEKMRLGRNNPAVSFNFVITNQNYEKLYDHIKALVALNIDKLTISNTQFITKQMAYAHKLALPDDSVTESSVFSYDPTAIDTRLLFQQVRRVFEDFGGFNIAIVPNIRTFSQFERYYKQPDKFIRGYKVCYYPWRFAHILPNADVVVSWRCFSKPLGNIKKDSFIKIWNDLPIQDFRLKIAKNKGSYPLCSRCGFLWCSYNM